MMYRQSEVRNRVGSRPMTLDTPIVYVVDDDVSVRESLELLFQTAGWRVELFESAGEFLAQPNVNVPNCMILDINLPELSGLDLQQIIASERSEMPIIFVTGYGDIPTSVSAMKAGAMEFLTKPFRDDVLLAAVDQAIERSCASLALRSDIQALQDRHASLSRREQEVMVRVVAGLLNKQIAYELGISEITVKAHRGQAMRKMQARSVPDLVNMAATLGLTNQTAPAMGRSEI